MVDARKTLETIEPRNQLGRGFSPVPWSVWAIFWVSLCAFLLPNFIAGIVLGALAGAQNLTVDTFYTKYSDNFLFLYLLPLGIYALGGAVIYLFLRAKKGLTHLGFKWTGWSDTLTAIPGYMVYFVALAAANIGVALLLPDSNILEQEQNIGIADASGLTLIAAFGLLVVAAPFFEELMFRGFAFRGVASKYGFWPAAIITSGLFGLAHGQWNVGIDTFILGIVACRLVWNTNSIWPAILLHVIKNSIAFIFIFIVELPSGL